MIKAYAAFEAGGKLRPFEYDPGELGGDEVELAVEHCGICHSDLSMLSNDWGVSSYPLVPGHEIIGTILAMGNAVTGLEIGQYVGVGWHSGYCMNCQSCLSGDHNLCESAEPTIVAHYGGFAERVRARAASVIPLPSEMDSKTAGPLFCGGITVFNPLVQFAVKPGDRVGVIGIGGLGHLALAFLNAWGCEVTAFSSSAEKRQAALELGAHEALDSRDPATLKRVAGRFDMIMSTVNVALDWTAYMRALKRKGRLHFAGVVLDPVELQVKSMISGQHSVSGSPVGAPATIATMLDFAVRHGITPVTEHYEFDQVNEALEKIRSGRARYRVVLSR